MVSATEKSINISYVIWSEFDNYNKSWNYCDKENLTWNIFETYRG